MSGNLQEASWISALKFTQQRRTKSFSLLLSVFLVAGIFSATPAPAATSPLTWTIRTSAANNQWQSITYAKDATNSNTSVQSGLFVAVSNSGTNNRVMTSPDGITWTSRTTNSNAWAGVTYGNGRFVAVAGSGVGNRVMTSTDGFTWTVGTTPVDNGWISITYAKDSANADAGVKAGLFVAVAQSVPTGAPVNNTVMTSPDGLTWTTRTTPNNLLGTSVTYGNGTFVAVGANAGTYTGRAMTSSDGITWTDRTIGGTFLKAVGYGNGRFVATAATGTVCPVTSSTDGITWTCAAGVPDQAWSAVTYGDGLWVAVSTLGTGNRVMTSPNGTTWSLGQSAADNQWFGVTYGNGLFVAVSYNGTGNRVMTAVNALSPSSYVVTARNVTSTYGSPVGSVGYTSTPALAADDWFPSLSCGAYSSADTSTALTGSEIPGGTYKTICTGSATTGKGVPITYATGTYTLTKASVTLSAASKNKTYGDTVTLDTATDWSVAAGGLVNGDTWATKTLTVSGTPGGDQPLAGVTTYTITPGGTINGKNINDYYTVTPQTGTLTVSKATLIVTPNNQTVQSGASAPASAFYTFSLSGFVNSETSSALTTQPSCTSTYANGDSGTKTITCGSGVAANYTFQYGTATLTITPPKVIITANSGTSVYGASLQTVTSPGYSSSDPSASLPTITCQRYEADNSTPLASTSKPGSYKVVCTGASQTTDASPRDIEYVDGTYTITKATLSVAAQNRNKEYGAALAPGTNSNSDITGLYSGDAISISYDYSSGDAQSASVGSYTITPSGTLNAGSNCSVLANCYNVAFNTGSLSVSPALLHVNPNSQSVVFGGAAPTYTYSIPSSDFKNGDTTIAGITCTSAYTTTTPIGTVLPITCSGGTTSNYTILYGTASLTVRSAGIRVQNSSTPLTSTANPTGVVTLSATLLGDSSWSAGCRVIWTLDPNINGVGSYYAYPTAEQISSGSPVTLNVTLPIGVYNVVISLDTNCSNADAVDPSGVVVVAPSVLGLGSAGGGWYRTSNGGPKQSFGYVMQVKKMANPDKSTTWTYWGQSIWTISSGWRIKMSINKTVTQYASGILSGAQPWGVFNCPADTWTPQTAPNASCGSFVGLADLQKWTVVDGIGSWQTLGQVAQTVTLYDGGTLTNCKNKKCQSTDMADWFGSTLQIIPTETLTTSDIPQGLPAVISQGQIRIWN